MLFDIATEELSRLEMVGQTTIASTLSDDYILRAFSRIRISTSVRRGLSAVPAAFILSRGLDPLQLILWTQAILTCILPIVLVPLLILIREAGQGALIGSSRWLITLAVAGVACIALDLALISTFIQQTI
jgi:Mn2+/Fe2+ NRAMP family transporter